MKLSNRVKELYDTYEQAEENKIRAEIKVEDITKTAH
jgi:hypothetical protein